MQSQLDRAWEKLACVLATGAGIGLMPFAPGTFGSLWGLLITWVLQALGWSVAGQIVVLAAMGLVGIPICGRAARAFGGKDPGKIVYDELAALPLAFIAVPFDAMTGLLGFLLFRLLDIAKPWPVRKLEQLPGGLGIMADDIAAAAYTAIVLWGTLKLTGRV